MSQFIAATLDLLAAFHRAIDDNCVRIAVIDLDGLVYFDNSTKIQAMCNIFAYPGEKGKYKQKYYDFCTDTAVASAEIDFERSIPADHYFVVTVAELHSYLEWAMYADASECHGIMPWLLERHSFGENR